MEKRNTIISLIAVCVIVGCTIAFIIISGITAKDYNYVQIEVNPRVEFICDNDFIVVSLQPLNQDARIVLSDIDLIGLDIEEASTMFICECAKSGFIDVNGVNNATNITVIDGITQALDVHVTQSIYNYFKENEIMSAVTENYENRKMFDKKKEYNICCSNKFKLISTINEKDPSQNIDSLKKHNEVSLVEMVYNEHKNNKYIPTQEEIDTKQSLINQNKLTYEKHNRAISNNTQKEFSELFDKFQKSSTKDYLQDFEKEYKIWQENRVL